MPTRLLIDQSAQCYDTNIQGRRNRAGGAIAPSQILVDILTLTLIKRVRLCPPNYYHSKVHRCSDTNMQGRRNWAEGNPPEFG